MLVLSLMAVGRTSDEVFASSLPNLLRNSLSWVLRLLRDPQIWHRFPHARGLLREVGDTRLHRVSAVVLFGAG